MNHTTKAEQESILSTARRLIELGPDGVETNYPEVITALQAQHGINKDRARQYAAKAARIARGEMDKKNFIAWRSTDDDRAIIARILAAYPDLENVTSRAIRKALRYWSEHNPEPGSEALKK